MTIPCCQLKWVGIGRHWPYGPLRAHYVVDAKKHGV